ncbi:MAG: polymer-forming cytoskeletal protein [Betaproteobacteria bacterium]|nr:MAG: polymer-forming cytoskeletal protein [Betaproteobacteria bacterium]TMH07595.1 MAG: polymer-forming cytoskeletal protein [Betaproteobacteria bacterium]
MFDRKKPRAPRKRIDSLIGAGTTVSGDIAFSGGLRVDGKVIGKVTTLDNQPGTLVISEQARVDGEVRVSHVVVNGEVSGSLIANDYLELQAKARVNADVAYRMLEMHFGAIVEGKLMHSEPESASIFELRRASGE